MSGAPGVEFVQVKDLKAGMKNINAVMIVLEVGPPTLTKEAREVRTLRVADASAAVNLSVWDAAGALLQPGDIVRITRGYAALWRGALTLYSGKNGDLHKVGEFCMLFNEQVNMSEPQPVAPAAVGAGAAGERANGAHNPPRAAAAGPPAAPKAERFSAAATAAAGGGGGGGGDGKHAHKTYVRGGARQHPRGNSRR